MLNLHVAGLALAGILAVGGIGAAGIHAAAPAAAEATTLQSVTLNRATPRLLDQAERKAVIADTLGLTVEELEAARADGVTLRELAAQQGVTPEAIRDALRTALADAVDTALAEGELSEAQADAILERLALDEIMAEAFGPEEKTIALADAVGLTVEELEDAWAAGSTLRELVEAQGVDPAAVRYELVTSRDQAIDQALNDGLITPAQALRLRAAPRRAARLLWPGPAPAPAPEA